MKVARLTARACWTPLQIRFYFRLFAADKRDAFRRCDAADQALREEDLEPSVEDKEVLVEMVQGFR